jgi:hypothetical protein
MKKEAIYTVLGTWDKLRITNYDGLFVICNLSKHKIIPRAVY